MIAELRPLADGPPNIEKPKLAYTLQEAAAAVGVSVSLLRGQIIHHFLLARYVNTKPIILHEDLVSWLQALPTEPKKRWT